MLKRGLDASLARRLVRQSVKLNRSFAGGFASGTAQAPSTGLYGNKNGVMFCLTLAWRKAYLTAARRSFSEDGGSSPSFLFPAFFATLAASLLGTVGCADSSGKNNEEEVKAVLDELEKTKDKFGPGNSMYIVPENLRLVRKLNEGTFGQIWLGKLTDGSHVEEVAVKVLSEEFVARGALTEILKVEAQIFHRVSTRCHHVCRLYGVACKGEQVCLVMKLYKKSLYDLLHEKQGRIPLSDLQKYGLQVCQGLVELHEQGVIMQDLKPSNVLIDDLDHAVLADFGMASFVDREKGASVVTAAKGTPSYMAPEAWDPKSMGGMSIKTDIWSLACVIIELYTGFPPWHGLEIHDISGKVKDEMHMPRIPRGMPPVLADAIRRCLSFDPKDRPQAREMLEVFAASWEAIDEREEFQGCVPVIQGSYYVPGTVPNPVPVIQGSYWVAEETKQPSPMVQGSYYVPSTDGEPPMIQGSLYVPNDLVMKRAPSLKQLRQSHKELGRAVSRYAQMVEAV